MGIFICKLISSLLAECMLTFSNKLEISICFLSLWILLIIMDTTNNNKLQCFSFMYMLEA